MKLRFFSEDAKASFAGRLPKTAAVSTGLLLFAAAPALAHHPFGGETPSNFITAFLSGLGHPVIGLDHLAFVVAAGLLAAAIGGGLLIPLGFVAVSMVGAGLHLMGITLPLPELVIALSVVAAGGLLALKTPPHRSVALGLVAIAGLFHGFAYGEAIFGAEMGPLVGYFLGFTAIQLAIAALAYGITRALLNRPTPTLGLRLAGCVIGGMGAAFFAAAL